MPDRPDAGSGFTPNGLPVLFTADATGHYVAQSAAQNAWLDRLFEKPGYCAFVDCTDYGLPVAVTAEHDADRTGVNSADALEKLDAVHAWHQIIRYDDADSVLRQQF